MKQCTYCGNEYSDELEVCPNDGKPLRQVGEIQTPEILSPDVERVDKMSLEEQQLWARMTFRQFAILIIRLQAVWLFLTAAIDATYLSRYIDLSSSVSIYSELTRAGRLELLLLILRIMMQVAAAVALIQHAERVLRWLVRDWLPKPPKKQNEMDAT